MQRDSPPPHKRIFATPRGTAGLDVAGTSRRAFVTVTLFDDGGWATDEDMWWSGQSEGLAERVAVLTGMQQAEADAVVGDFMSAWEASGGPAKGATMTHLFRYGLVGVLLSVAGLAGGASWAFRRRPGS
jgi:hypothetical protein